MKNKQNKNSALNSFIESVDLNQETEDIKLSKTDKARVAAIKKQLKDETIDNELHNDLLMELSGYGVDIESF